MGLTSRRAPGQRTQVLLLTAALLAAGVALWALALPAPTAPDGTTWALAGMLVLAVVASEWTGVHLEVGRTAYTVGLSEIPTVMALFWLPPWLVVAVRVVGGLATYQVRRRSNALKQLFNGVTLALETVVVLVVLEALGTDLTGSLHTAWGALVLGFVLGSLINGAAVLTVVRLTSDGGLVPGAVREVLLQSGPTTVVAATVGFVLGRSIDRDPAVAGPLLVLGACVGLGYVSHMRLRERHRRLSSLYGFVHEVSTASTKDGPVTAVLTHTLTLLKGEVAVLVQVVDSAEGPRVLRRHRLEEGGALVTTESPAGPADWPITRCLDTGRPLLGRRGDDDHAVAAWLQSEQVEDGVLVAVHGQEGALTGTLFVGGRRGVHTTFEQDDLTALEGLAGHASVALHNGWLVERLTYESRHDLLTSLPNRSEFQARLREVLARGEGAAVMFMDLDRFKDVNDTLGHLSGDRLLQLVADRLSGALTAPATVARLGGDEFAVILPGHDAVRASEVARHLRALVQEPVDLDGLSVDVGVSIGLALTPEHGEDVSLLMRRADIAMYDAKERDGVAVYDAARTEEPSSSRLALVTQLRQGLVEGQFLLHYQPQVSAVDGRTVRFEALIRWRHPVRGMVAPDEFIPVAERAGMLQEITQWVLRRALDDLLRWRRNGLDVGVSVNLSPRNLLDPSLAANVRHELARRDLPAGALTLEITEATLMADPERAILTLQQLRETGVRLSIDDFGTGYSSLAYLKLLPVDEVKIDRSFVRDLSEDPTDVAIVRAVVALAESLHLEVVAEGVEDQASQSLLRALGCRYLQGYHLSRPMAEEAVLPWLGDQGARPWSTAAGLLPTQRHADGASA